LIPIGEIERRYKRVAIALTMRVPRSYEYRSPGALFPFASCYTPLEGTGSYKEGPDRFISLWVLTR
jgi:hypothetical protein